MITVRQLMEFLEEAEDKPLKIKLPDGEVPEHFHITEIGKVNKTFVDCGGAIRVMEYCSMQVWVATDVDHRISPDKLQGMIGKSHALVEFDDDLPVMIEYGENVVSLYELDNVSDDVFYIEPKQTECLAPEICGVEVLESKCCGGKGC